MTHRVRFEVRVLGVATAETWYFVDEMLESVEMPTRDGQANEWARPCRRVRPRKDIRRAREDDRMTGQLIHRRNRSIWAWALSSCSVRHPLRQRS